MQRRAGASTRWIAGVVVVCAALQALIYFGHQAVPNPDFIGFKLTADAVLAGEFPVGQKRTPVLGLIHHALGLVVPGPRRELTAGWLLNAGLHPLTGLLFFALARKRIGDVFAGFLSLALLSNPMTISALVQPLAETLLAFLAVAFFWALDRRSQATWWLAGLASAVRYDAATLVAVACVVALVEAGTRRERLVALAKSALAILPAAAWLLTAAYLWPANNGGRNYLDDVQARKLWSSLGSLLEVSWQVTAAPYGSWAPTWAGTWGPVAQGGCMAAGAILLVLGAGRALRTRDRAVLAAMLHAAAFAAFLLSYWVIPRYCASLSWVYLLLMASGLHGLAGLLPRGAVWSAALRWAVALGALAWGSVLVRRLGPLAELFPSTHLVLGLTLASLAAVTLIGALDRSGDAAARGRWLLPGAAVFCTMLLSNHRTLSNTVADGRFTYEFQELGAWLSRTAQPDDVVYADSPGLLRYFLEPQAPAIIDVRATHGDTARKFFDFCEVKQADYICLHRVGPSSGLRSSGFELQMAASEAESSPYRRVEVIENPLHHCEMVIFARR